MANSVRISLANGKGVAVIDADDAERIPLTGWHWASGGYAQHRCRKPDGKHSHVLLHRLIMSVGANQFIDHINHDKLDCRKSNLRVVSGSENMQNRSGPMVRNKLGVRGVIAYPTKLGTRYRVAIKAGKRHIHHYGFQTLASATLAAQLLRSRHFSVPGGSVR